MAKILKSNILKPKLNVIQNTSEDVVIRVKDFNVIANRPLFIEKLRRLTLGGSSGMNYELDHLITSSMIRKVNAKVLLAIKNKKLVGWALLSREPSNFRFRDSWDGYSPITQGGTLFEIYVSSNYRRMGIGTKLFKVAKHKAKPYKLFSVPWDERSDNFYKSLKK